MNKVMLIVIGVVVVLGGSAFAQQEDSKKTPVDFQTPNGNAVPVFEVMGQSYGFGSAWIGGTSGTVTTQNTSLRPAVMAPMTIDLPDGWHRFQIGEYWLFNRQFDVVAKGTPQTWLIKGGNPWGYFGGLFFAVVGGGTALAGSIELATTGSPGLSTSQLAILTIGCGLACAGGIWLAVSTAPSATRTQ